MLIGVPKEIKIREYRVGIVPTNVRALTLRGHQVMIETGAGSGIAASDIEYETAGAIIAHSPEQIFDAAEMIIKVKEPQEQERKLLRAGQVLFTYLHLAPDPPQALDLINSKATCIAYETVTDKHGNLPLLAPMSAVAGRLSVQAGAHFLERPYGSMGVLLGGVTGATNAKVVIIGGGVVGSNAARMALGMGAEVWVLDSNTGVLKKLTKQFGPLLNTTLSNTKTIERHCLEADLVIIGVLIPGAEAPKIITRSMIKHMKPGAVIVDVAMDQGGGCETSRATTHDHPTYIVDGVIHYCVTNMPAAVPKTSAYALNNATHPFILELADKGLDALKSDSHLLQGLCIHRGMVTNRAIADALGCPYVSAGKALGI